MGVRCLRPQEGRNLRRMCGEDERLLAETVQYLSGPPVPRLQARARHVSGADRQVMAADTTWRAAPKGPVTVGGLSARRKTESNRAPNPTAAQGRNT